MSKYEEFSPIKKWIYDKGMTIPEFCKCMGINVSSFYRWTSRKSNPRPKTMKFLREITNNSVKTPCDLKDKNPFPR